MTVALVVIIMLPIYIVLSGEESSRDVISENIVQLTRLFISYLLTR